jgi:hypothetical protein
MSTSQRAGECIVEWDAYIHDEEALIWAVAVMLRRPYMPGVDKSVDNSYGSAILPNV